MICPKCRKAGRIVTEANSIAEGNPDRVGVPTMLREATELHGQCKGGNWCDCHHDTGQALNMTLIANASG